MRQTCEIPLSSRKRRPLVVLRFRCR